MCCTRLAENTGRKKSPFLHHRTTLSGCIFAPEACIDNWKKSFLNNDTSSLCPHNMVNFGLLTAEICWRVWGTPANFNGFRVLFRYSLRLKNVTGLSYYNFDTHEPILIIFGRSDSEKVANQKLFYFCRLT